MDGSMILTSKAMSIASVVRGIEQESRKEQRLAHTSKVRRALFWELEQQRCTGTNSPEELAKALSEESRISTEEALARAQADSEAAMDHTTTTTKKQSHPVLQNGRYAPPRTASGTRGLTSITMQRRIR
jgi:hypothetical protein